jgi:hypothetical protein
MEELDIDDAISPSCNSTEFPDILFNRCEDGTCRPLTINDAGEYGYTCLEYMGCSVVLPFHCPNGNCVENETMCIGQS